MLRERGDFWLQVSSNVPPFAHCSLGIIEEGHGAEDVSTQLDHVVTVGGGGGLADGYNALGIGSILGSEGAIELTIFNPLERPATRPAAIIVPCGYTNGKRGSWFAVYGDEEGKGGMNEPPPDLLKSQVFPMLVPMESGRGMTLKGVEEGEEKAGMCKMIIAVKLPGLASRKVVVFWSEFTERGKEEKVGAGERKTTENGSNGESSSGLKALLKGLTSNILTSDDVLRGVKRGQKQAFRVAPSPDLKDDSGGDLTFLIEYDATGKNDYKVKVSKGESPKTSPVIMSRKVTS